MTSFVLALALLPGGVESETDLLSPYVDTSRILVEGDSSFAEPRALIGGVDLVFMLSIVITDDLNDLSGVDLEAENVFSGSAALWYHFGPNSAFEFKLAYIDKTKYKDIGGTTVAEVDSMEATVAYVYFLGDLDRIKGYLLAGGGVHRWKGSGVIDDEDDYVAVAGGGVIIKLGSRVGLVFDARYARIFVENADPQDNWHVGAGLSVSLGS
jgi:hypothetical protein